MENKIIIKILVENSVDYLNVIDMFMKLNNSSTCHSYSSFETAINMGAITKDNIEMCKKNFYFGKAYGIDHYKANFVPENHIILESGSFEVLNEGDSKNNDKKEYIFDLQVSSNYKLNNELGAWHYGR